MYSYNGERPRSSLYYNNIILSTTVLSDIGRSTDALTKTNEHGLGVKVLLSHGLRAVFFTHPTQQIGSLPLANNIKHSIIIIPISGLYHHQ